MAAQATYLEAIDSGKLSSREAGLAGAAKQLQLALVGRDNGHAAAQASTVVLQPCRPIGNLRREVLTRPAAAGLLGEDSHTLPSRQASCSMCNYCHCADGLDQPREASQPKKLRLIASS